MRRGGVPKSCVVAVVEDDDEGGAWNGRGNGDVKRGVGGDAVA